MFVIVPSEKPVDFQRVSFVLFTFLMGEHVENERNSLFGRQFAAQKRGLVFGKGLILRQKRNRNGRVRRHVQIQLQPTQNPKGGGCVRLCLLHIACSLLDCAFCGGF